MISMLKSMMNNLIILFKNSTRFKKAACAALSFAVVTTIFVSVFAATDLTYALEVSVDGEKCGYVTHREIVDKAVDSLDEISLSEDEAYSKPQVDCTHTLVPSSQLISSVELADNIVSNDEKVNKVICVFVNGVAFAEVASMEKGVELLTNLAGENSFYNEIEIRECVMSDVAQKRIALLENRLEDKVTTTVEYKTAAEDTKQSIGEKFAISADDVPDFNHGDLIEITAFLPAFALVTKADTEHKRSIPSTAECPDSYWEITTYSAIYVDGIKLRTEYSGTELVKKYPDQPTATAVVSVGKYGFCWPVDTGYRQYVSSYVGDGRGHAGYDIAASKGTPILSVLSGKVESVNSSGSAYGLHFVINHGNGLKTLYAHCSKLFVSVGDRVERGEVVALIGATGRSTGPHLHFEVRKNGALANPTNYIGKR